MRNERCRFGVLLALLLDTIVVGWPPIAMSAPEDSLVSVVVSEDVASATKVTYSYSAENGASKPIVELQVGLDYYRSLDELTDFPDGFTEDVLSTGIQSPPGWGGEFVLTEESERARVRWFVVDPMAALQPSTKMGGFSITLPKTSQVYRQPHWTVSFDDSTVASNLALQAGNPRVIGSITKIENDQVSGREIVTLTMRNPDARQEVSGLITGISIRAIGGTGSATTSVPAGGIPIAILRPGELVEIPILVQLDDAVRRCAITESGVLYRNGVSYRFSIAQSFLRKQPVTAQ